MELGFQTCQNKFQHCFSCFFCSMFIFFKSLCVYAFLYFCSSCIYFTFIVLIIYSIIYQVSLKIILKKEYTCNGESIIGIVSAKRDRRVHI